MLASRTTPTRVVTVFVIAVAVAYILTEIVWGATGGAVVGLTFRDPLFQQKFAAAEDREARQALVEAVLSDLNWFALTAFVSAAVYGFRKVALKVIGTSLGMTTKAVLRFRREAEAAASLHHTNIVPIYATGEDEGTHYYAMELIEGPSLNLVISAMRFAGTEGRSDAFGGAAGDNTQTSESAQRVAEDAGESTALALPSSSKRLPVDAATSTGIRPLPLFSSFAVAVQPPSPFSARAGSIRRYSGMTISKNH